MNRIITSTILVISLLASSFLPVASTMAASTSGFQAGRIMDDSVMADKNSMSVNDIQNFLNSKVPSCDTNGSQNSEMNNAGVPDYNGNGSIQRWEWGKAKYNQTTFPCLKNKTFSGKKAAKLIHEAAQTYSINPKVLLVLLQKEQGLITDTWPLNVQYRSATGYGCPDTAACDSQYYGLKNQLNQAANLFRTVLNGGWSNYPVGNNSIPWNPNIAACGYSTVNVQNRATSALYRYTPYRPNQAALNAGYGTGNGCSSYGNRNFYLYFTDWFGSTTISLFTINGGGGTLYLTYGNYYYAIPNMDMFRSWGLAGSKIKSVSSSQLSSYTQGPDLNNVATFGASSTAYFIDNGKYHSIPSMGVLNDYGYTGAAIKNFADDNLKNILSSGNATTNLAHTSSGTIYYIESSKKHQFPDYSTLTTLGPSLTGDSSLSRNSFSNFLLSKVTASYPILRDGSILKAKDSATIYLYNNSEIWPFTYNTWRSWGKKLDYAKFSGASVADLTVSSSSVPVLADDGTNKYLIDNGKKYKFTPATQTLWNLDDSQFSTLTTSTLSKLPSGQDVGEVVGTKSGRVFIIRDGKKLVVPSSSDYTGLGHNWKQVLRLSKNSLDLVPTGTTKALGPGSLVLVPGGTVNWIDTDFTMHQIPSLDVFNAYGFSWKNVRSFDSQALFGYTNTTLQTLFNSMGGDHYLADGGQKLSIDATTYGSSQYDLSDKPQIDLSDYLINRIGVGPPLSQFVRGSSATVFKVVNGEKRPIGSPVVFYEQGGSWSSIARVSNTFLDSLPTGTSY